MSQTRANMRSMNIFDSIEFEGIVKGNPLFFTQKKKYEDQAIKWFYDFIRNNVKYANVFKNQNRNTRQMIVPGHLYTWQYQAKNADTLPYWDAQPMGWILSDEGEFFRALNLHYLTPRARIVILKYMYSILSNTTYDENTKARLSWQRMKRLSLFPYFQIMIHSYRKDHVRSQFIKVPVKHWPIAAFLPSQKWRKATSQQVYRATGQNGSSRPRKRT